MVMLMDAKVIIDKIKNLLEKTLYLSDIDIAYKESSYFSGPDVASVFDPRTYAIFINQDWLGQSNIIELSVMLAHEMRHAYQRAMIDYPHLMPDLESKDTIESRKMDFEQYEKPYIDGNLNANYEHQSIEIDARSFSQNFIESILEDIN